MLISMLHTIIISKVHRMKSPHYWSEPMVIYQFFLILFFIVPKAYYMHSVKRKAYYMLASEKYVFRVFIDYAFFLVVNVWCSLPVFIRKYNLSKDEQLLIASFLFTLHVCSYDDKRAHGSANCIHQLIKSLRLVKRIVALIGWPSITTAELRTSLDITALFRWTYRWSTWGSGS
jgi:hypothetical protein